MENKLTYGEALEAVKQGKLISREGWNGKGMFVFMRPSDSLNISFLIEKVKSLPDSLKVFFLRKEELKEPSEQGLEQIKFTAYLCMYAADGSIVNGWLASQTDMLSNDWCILN
jgi:hypothetical protein